MVMTMGGLHECAGALRSGLRSWAATSPLLEGEAAVENMLDGPGCMHTCRLWRLFW